MIALTRAGWIASAALFGALLASLLGVHFAGPAPFAILVGVATLSFVRADWALPGVAALMPIAWFSATRLWNAQVAWAEALACAALAGLALDACRARTPVPRPLAAPAAVFGAIVVASLAAGLRVLALREGPAIWPRVSDIVSHSYFIDHSLTQVHAGLLLLEGTLLFAHAARIGTRPGGLRRVCAGTALGSAAAAICTIDRLAEAAARAPSFWTSLFDLAGRLRWNVHYEDYNAAGSYFALAVLAGAAMAVSSAGARRAIWTACAALAGVALWLTSSRIALLAAPAAAAGIFTLPAALRGRRQAALAGAAGIAACAVLALIGVFLPQRGIQQSSLLAVQTRFGLVETGLHMMRAHPAFGIGLGEFQQRSGEFSSPELLAKFPPAVHENAHNNVVQIAAETGIAGGLAFTWTIGAALLAVGWRATASRDRFLQLVLAALAAYLLTALAGHPMLVPEAAFGFWLLAGAAGGAALADRSAVPRGRRSTIVAAAALTLVAITLPLRMGAAAREANLEHVGIGVSSWRLTPDGVRYREASGYATLFAPTTAYKFSVRLRGGAALPLEVSVDGRVANVLVVTPDRWTDIVVPARTVPTEARFRRMDLRTPSDDRAVLWLTKDEPVLAR
jgi:O-antigen ligase